jgi:hypothetical protein
MASSSDAVVGGKGQLRLDTCHLGKGRESTDWGEEWAGGWQHGRSAVSVASALVILFVDAGLAWDTHLEHVKKGRLAGVVKTQEQQLGVLVQQAEAGEDIVDYSESSRQMSARDAPMMPRSGEGEHTPVDYPHRCGGGGKSMMLEVCLSA